jgi:hypothetical protein
MSDRDDDGWTELDDDEAPDMKTEEGRDTWIEFIMDQDEWVQAQVIHDGDNLIARFKWDDGREEIFDCEIRRNMEIVRKSGPEGSN